MPFKVNVQPQLLRWARERAQLAPADLARKISLKAERVAEWERTGELTLAHLRKVAEKTHTPIGYLFLAEPPGSPDLPVADFRTPAGGRPKQPSQDLLDTMYLCEQRQDWYRAHVAGNDPELEFVGSAHDAESITEVARRIRETIGLDPSQRAKTTDWADALRDLFDRVEDAGILVMRNGIVGNNTHRPLSVEEFRGFALSDSLAPLIFVNAADSKAAQMFTVAHELVHIWRGESGVSDVAPRSDVPTERFCNQTAAEILVPMDEFVRAWRRTDDPAEESQRLSRAFKVSTLVVLIRAREADAISQQTFDRVYKDQAERAAVRRPGDGGGDFYRTQRSRLGKRFASAVVVAAMEGRASYTEAFNLLGVRKSETFDELARNLGVIL